MRRLLVAHRGEIADRVLDAAVGLGIATVAVHARDDVDPPHAHRADRVVALAGRGAAAYLDVDDLVGAAARAGADAVHPGYGFLSEDAAFPTALAAAGIGFVGPDPEVLRVLGDKAAALDLARGLGLDVAEATGPGASPDDARRLLAAGPVMLKAVHGGGGRGIRVVRDGDDVDAAVAAASREAAAASGDPALYAERFVPDARHVEVQVLGDRHGHVTALGTRDCSLQRRHQKLVELAPAPWLDPATERLLVENATAIARAVGLDSLATVEFLVDAAGRAVFIEANPRLQVEHTVTEAVTGIDLVAAQLRVADGATLGELGLDVPPVARGRAVQFRLNAETVGRDGTVAAGAGILTRVDLPRGSHVRVDTDVRVGDTVSPSYDPLLAKIVVRHAGDDVEALLRLARHLLHDARVDGVATNLAFLHGLAAELADGPWSTGFVDERTPGIVDRTDDGSRAGIPAAGDGEVLVTAPMAGTVVSVTAAPGDLLAPDATVVVLETMKMEHAIAAGAPMTVTGIGVDVGAVVAGGAVLARGTPEPDAAVDGGPGASVDLDHVRGDLAELRERQAATLDAARPDALATIRETGRWTARERVDALVDPGSFREFGSLVVAAQRRRRDLDDLVAATPADGLVTGHATVHADAVGPEAARATVMAYDYSVLAGTQGILNHRKTDRMIELAARAGRPFVLFAEGGGGRPGDTDGFLGLDVLAFRLFGALARTVPTIAVVTGRCFAGNAALAGCCDVIVAVEGASLGMAGPAMISAGGLGRFAADEVGPVEAHVAAGSVDVVVADEGSAIAAARTCLAFFQGDRPPGEEPDPRRLRHVVPENRLRAFDVHGVIEGVVDVGSFLELRPHFAPSMVVGLARIAGRPVGVLANNSLVDAGAITRDGAQKAIELMELCDRNGLAVVSFCDTPGIMVGPEAERSGQVRHTSRVFVVAAHLSVPIVTVVVRKAYGLGAMAMAGGSFRGVSGVVAWPTGEVGPMGLEGGVRLGFRRELEAAADDDARRALFDRLVAEAYEAGRALSSAMQFEIDQVIDPAETRAWVLACLSGYGPGSGRPERLS